MLNNSLTFFDPSVGYSICHLDSCTCNGGSAECRDQGSVHGRSDTNSPESYRDSRCETLLPPFITVQVIIYEDISGFSYFYLTSCQISQVLKISVVWKEVTFFFWRDYIINVKSHRCRGDHFCLWFIWQIQFHFKMEKWKNSGETKMKETLNSR